MAWTRRVAPITEIYRNLNTGVYSVQPFTEGPVATTAFGDPTEILPQEFDERIVNAVIANLEKFGKDKFEEHRAIRRNPEEQRSFIKAHVAVSIRKDPTGRLIVRPLHRERGGFVGFDEDAIILEAEQIGAKIAAAVMEAFRRAT